MSRHAAPHFMPIKPSLDVECGQTFNGAPGFSFFALCPHHHPATNSLALSRIALQQFCSLPPIPTHISSSSARLMPICFCTAYHILLFSNPPSPPHPTPHTRSHSHLIIVCQVDAHLGLHRISCSFVLQPTAPHTPPTPHTHSHSHLVILCQVDAHLCLHHVVSMLLPATCVIVRAARHVPLAKGPARAGGAQQAAEVCFNACWAAQACIDTASLRADMWPAAAAGARMHSGIALRCAVCAAGAATPPAHSRVAAAADADKVGDGAARRVDARAAAGALVVHARQVVLPGTPHHVLQVLC